MANSHHLEILNNGVDVWNRWRLDNPYVIPDLSEVDLSRTQLQSVNFFRANLSETNFSESDLRKAILREANLDLVMLIRANLSQASIYGADLSEAKLINAKLRGAGLNRVNFREAKLINADLTGAMLYRVNFSSSILMGANLKSARVGFSTFANIDLSKVFGLEEITHYGPSTIGIDTIRNSKGSIPVAFLRGCGVNDIEIEFAKLASLGLDPEQVIDINYRIHEIYTGKGIQYNSCFISYSSKDIDFAQQLYNDLQENGVRCWFAPEDLKIGDRIRPIIDQQIRLRDKSLVIISKNSIQSEWVGDEVEATFEKETVENRTILFPIRIDNAVMDTQEDWAAKIRRRCHIGDFSKWRNQIDYQKAFTQLLYDLEATHAHKQSFRDRS